LILDPFNGRGSTAITSLYLQRRFIGFEINKTSLNKTKEVITNHLDVTDDRWTIHEGCGCEMKELESESEIIDAVFSSPPYYNKAESYSDDPRDLCNMSIEEFDQKIDQMFGNITRLIKRSDYEKKIFYPIIFVVGTSRKGRDGIQDMSFTFQQIAKSHGLKLWDQLFVELNNPHLVSSLQRNYEHKFVQKNYESQLCWVKF
jgi:DNA modification methylase